MKLGPEHIEDLRLRELASGTKLVRPCPGCTRPCACSGSTACGCRCTWGCERASQRLAGGAPVASDLLPLAFEFGGLLHLRLLCASAGSELCPPRVTFQTEPGFPIWLLQRLLQRLFAKRALRSEWVVRPDEAPEYPLTQFVCEPNPDFHHDSDDLRRDIRSLANHLHSGLANEARAELSRERPSHA